MSNIGSYKNTAFNESQKFLVHDPATGSTSLVLGSSLIDYITPRLNSVTAETTRLSAENTDYEVGTLVQTSGATAVGDGLASVYLVVEGGTGDFPMINGNDLLVITGDDDLREQLASTTPGEGASLVSFESGNTVQDLESTAAGEGASLVSMEGGPSVEVGTVKRVDSLAALKSLTGVDGRQSSLSGSRAGVFKFDASDLSTEVTNDPQEGVYVAPDSDPTGASGAWVRQYSGAVNLKWFGAVGDGVTDDSTAIQAAIDFGEPIEIPEGDFLADALSITSGMTMFGRSESCKILHATVAGESQLFNMDSNAGNVYIHGVSFDGRQQSQPQSPTEIRLFSASQNPNYAEYRFHNCNFENVHTKGIFVQTDGTARSKLDVVDCDFENIYEDEDASWNPSFCTLSENIDFYAAGNSFKAGYSFTQDGAMAIDHSSRLAASPVNEYARIRIVGNYFEGMGRNAPVSGNALGCIELRLWTEVTVISGNNFRGCYHTPIRGKTDCKEVAVTGNTIRNCNGGGIEMLRGVSTGPIIGRMSITGNVISVPQTNGITVAGAAGDESQDWVIQGNVVANAGAVGIDVNYADNVNISGNTIFNSTDQGIKVLEAGVLTINGNNSDASGNQSGIEAINCEYVICSNNHVNQADDVGIRVGGVTKAAVNGNIVSNRANVGGNDVDYRLTSGTTLVTTGNVGTTISTFGFTTTVNANNEF